MNIFLQFKKCIGMTSKNQTKICNFERWDEPSEIQMIESTLGFWIELKIET